MDQYLDSFSKKVFWCISITEPKEYIMTVHVRCAYTNMLSRATYPGAPSYGGMRTWVEGVTLHTTV